MKNYGLSILLWGTACLLQAAVEKVEKKELRAAHEGRVYRRLDVGLTGKATGFVAAVGARAGYFTTAPEFVFVQTGSNANWKSGTVSYEAAKGTGFALILPADKRQWNGKLYFTVHGAGASFSKGSLKAWNNRVDESDALADLTRYEESMIEKGYVVAKSFRSTDKNNGDCQVSLDGGTQRGGYNITEMPHLMLEFSLIARDIILAELGESPRRTYWYGHSAGGRVGRLLNYIPSLNRRPDGRPAFDGFLIDDSATGLWLPVLLRNGKDILFESAQERDAFRPQIDVTHQLYIAQKDEPAPEWVSESYLINKWRHTQMMREKGLGDKHRMYEVRGVSHSGGESGKQSGDVKILPLWKLMDSLIDRLDEWVERGIDPPATRSDGKLLAGSGSGAGAGGPEASAKMAAIAMPEVACPVGVYFQYPRSRGASGIGLTGFASFDAQLLEPLDGRGVFVDMNRNSFQDYRESMAEAWRRMGLLAKEQNLDREQYVNCVKRSVDALVEDRLLSPVIGAQYLALAREEALPLQ